MKRVHSFLHLVIIFLAVISTTVSLSIFTVRQQLLDDQIYKDAVSQSGIYSTVDSIAQERVSNVLVNVGNGIIAMLEDSPRKEERVKPREKHGFRTVLSTQSPVEKPGGKEENLRQSIVDNYEQIIFLNIRKLIENQTRQLISQDFEHIKFRQLLQSEVEQGISNDIAWIKGEERNSRLFSYIPQPGEVGQSNNSLYGEMTGQMMQQALRMRQWTRSTQEVAQGLFIVGFIMIVVAVITTQKRKTRELLKMCLTTGLTMMTLAFAHYFLISNIILQKLSIYSWPYFRTFLTPELNISLLQNINYIVSYVLHQAVINMFWMGAAISSFFGFALFVEWFSYRRRGKQ